MLPRYEVRPPGLEFAEEGRPRIATEENRVAQIAKFRRELATAKAGQPVPRGDSAWITNGGWLCLCWELGKGTAGMEQVGGLHGHAFCSPTSWQKVVVCMPGINCHTPGYPHCLPSLPFLG